MEQAGRLHVVHLQGVGQGDHLFRCDVGGDGNDAFRAGGHQRERLVVVAAQDDEVLGAVADDGTDLGIIAGCFLDGDDVGVLRQTEGCLGGQIGACAAGDIIEDNGLGRRIRNGCEVLIKAFLRGFIVIRNHDEIGVGIHALEALDVLQRAGQRVGADAGDDGEAACVLARQTKDFAALFHAQAGRLPCRSERNEEIDAGFDLAVDTFHISVIIDAAVFFEGRQEGRSAPADGRDRGIHHEIISSKIVFFAQILIPLQFRLGTNYLKTIKRMKKVVMMLAVTAMMILAVACGSKKKDVSKMTAPELAQEMVSAAKADDVAAFKAAYEAMDALDDDAAENAMEGLSESDQMTLAFYMLGHMEEITGESLDFGDLDSEDAVDFDFDEEDVADSLAVFEDVDFAE